MGFRASRAIRRCRGQRRLCEKCDLATEAPSRSIESLDASSEAGGGILNFIYTRRASVIRSAKVRGGILKFHSPPHFKISVAGAR